MVQPADLLEAFNRPAAVLGADGTPISANALFGAAGAPTDRLAGLEPGARLELSGPDGGWVWTASRLPGGERLLQAEPSAVQGLNTRERYLAALSHELRTPLNGVLGMAGLLAATRLNADQRTYVRALKDTGAHLLSLVNDVLDLAKLESGQIDLEPAPVDVEHLLQGVCELLSPRAHEKGLEIAWAAPDGPALIMADEGRLRQILFNLAGNAIKFTETGGVLMQVRRTERDGGVLRFSVTDTGPGVPEAERARIFEEYVRAPGATARLEGAGLGLAIVRRLAAAHGGGLGLTAPEEGGSEFWFEAAFEAVADTASDLPLAGLRIQIVSPSAIVRAAAARQIEACGGEAIASAAMPRRPAPGVAALLIDHRLTSEGAPWRGAGGAPAIVLLAAEQRSQIDGLRAAGFVGYLIKPLRRASVAERILAVVGRGGAGAEVRPMDDERVAAASAVGMRVLLAEDNPINALLARTLLEREGCAVELAGNGREAIEAALRGGHDLILMDLRMPLMDGLQASQALRAAGLKTPIVALTADAFEDDRKACLAAGMNDFLAKPLAIGALRAVLSRWTGAKAWTPELAKDKLAF
jgi:signal transduction histidine kinase/DNA-binding response OmpR family regulator